MTAFGVNLPLDDSVPILVVQVGGSVFGHGPLAIARTCGRMGIPVYGVPVETRVPGARSRYWTGLFSPPEENGSPDAWVDLILATYKRCVRSLRRTRRRACRGDAPALESIGSPFSGTFGVHDGGRRGGAGVAR